jgi:hypothetical protein
MRRREFLGAIATGLLFGNQAFAQAKIRRIGYLSAGSPATNESPTSGPVIRVSNAVAGSKEARSSLSGARQMVTLRDYLRL